MNTPDTSQESRPAAQKRIRQPSLYPKDSLREALVIAQAIRDTHAGKPLNRIMLADAIARTASSSAFRSLITSSSKYGLTIGNYNSETIVLRDRGGAATSPNEAERTEALRAAALEPPLFGRFYRHYDQNRLPRDDLAKKALTITFGVPHQTAEECLAVIKANGQFVGIIRETKGGPYVMLSGAEAAPPPGVEAAAEEEPAEAAGVEEATGVPAEPRKPPEPQKPARIFISHSKNEAIIDQVKTTLEFGGYDYEVAEAEETTAIPVPDKVLNAMRRCQAAVINLSADQEQQRPDGTYGINQNVLIEIGAAFVLYAKKVVLLVDKRVQLPSNLQGLYRCDYEGDELSWSAGMKLQKAVISFRAPGS